jgi:hypothetical protein
LDAVGPNSSLACTLSTEMKRLGKNCRWSQLIILLVSHRALCRHESHREGSAAVRCPTCGAKPGEKCDLSTLACHEQNRIETAA